MTREQYQRGVGHAHKMMDKRLEKEEIREELIKFGFDENQVDEVFGIILRATCNKLKRYYGKEVIIETLNK